MYDGLSVVIVMAWLEVWAWIDSKVLVITSTGSNIKNAYLIVEKFSTSKIEFVVKRVILHSKNLEKITDWLAPEFIG